MGKRKGWIDDEIKFLFDIETSFHEPATKDKEFQRMWKAEKARRLTTQPACLYCERPFSKKVVPILHHKEMPSRHRDITKKRAELMLQLLHNEITKEQAAEQYRAYLNEITRYYKTLQDTDLICMGCHAQQHPGVARSSRQRKLK